MSELPKRFIDECGWLKVGDLSNDLVVSSRIRLARNVEGIPFSQWASSIYGGLLIKHESHLRSAKLKDANIFNIEELDSIDRYFLVERYMISRELAKADRPCCHSSEQTSSVMINEEDHLSVY